MNLIEYFRVMYEYERKKGVLEKVQQYILGGKEDIINEICSGEVHLPSPFLIDELEWSMPLQYSISKEQFYQLKVTSREFYKSLVESSPGKYREHFERKGAAFGQQLICGIEDLRLKYGVKTRGIKDVVRLLLFKMQSLFSLYPEIFKGVYWSFVITLFFSIWYLCVFSNIDSPVFAVLFPAIVSSVVMVTAFFLESKVNVFNREDITGKNILANKYKDLINRVRYVHS